ncbi:MAG TPA: hypothetical protein VG326_18850 [Tepidisphaeraceae bacterium]|jgi:hypothetical protein|nr:hypothetical protein [Tepidisphaeraceae bacterium]
MRVSQSINVRRVTAAAAVAVSLLCGRARAQVLDQVPSDAFAVFEIKSLDGMNTKVAKMAKTFGLDEMNPDFKDPLSAMLEKGHISKGVDKSGDAALLLFMPEKHAKHEKHAEGEKPKKATPEQEEAKEEKAPNAGAGAHHDEPVAVALVPVSDYEAFVGNFKKADKAEAGGDITAVQDPDQRGKTMYLAHRGKYAIMSDKKAHIESKQIGMKLAGAALHEMESKDAVFFFNMPLLRERVAPEIKEHRAEWIDEMHKAMASEAQLKAFEPVFDTLVNEGLDTAEAFLNDADAVLFSVNLSDAGFASAGLVDFKAGSKYGKIVGHLKPGSASLLAGLPDKKYFAFGGMSVEGKASSEVLDDTLDPIIKKLNDANNDTGKKIAALLSDAKAMIAATNHYAVGVVMPTKGLGQESLLQEIAVNTGDAKTINDEEKKIIGETRDVMSLLPQNGAKTKITLGADKTVDGVTLSAYTTKFEFDENDPKGMQAQQMMAMMYGPNGVSGTFGVVNDKTFMMTQGVGDELLKEAVAAAKDGKDVLSDSAGVKVVAAELPKHPVIVYYIALDNIVTTAVRYAQGFGVPIKMKLPAALAPVGVSVSAEESTLRMDSFLPTQTVQSLIAASIQAYTQMQGGPGGGL